METPQPIFVSYKRADEQGWTWSIFNRLRQGDAYGEAAVVLDLDPATFAGGEAFPQKLQALVSNARVVLAVIGPKWLELLDTVEHPAGEQSDDWVRRELAQALAEGKRVIPVLVNGARMPAEADLPRELAPLANLQACEISGHRFEHDMGVLRRDIDIALPLAETSDRPSFVWLSDRASFTADIPSVTGILETIVIVAAYWYAAFYWGTYWPLLVGAAVMPLVLLRSDASVATGLRLFERWEKASQDIPEDWRQWPMRVWLALLISLLTATAASYWVATLMADRFLTGLQEGWGAVTMGVGVAIGFVSSAGAVAGAAVAVAAGAAARAGGGTVAVAGAGAVAVTAAVTGGVGAGWVAGAVGVTVAIMAGVVGVVAEAQEQAVAKAVAVVAGVVIILALPYIIGFSLGISIVMLAIRLLSTFVHLWSGLKALPRNFRRIVFCASPAQEPELLPGLPDNHAFRLPNLVGGIFRSDVDRIIELTLPLVGLIWFLPAWFYRISIKSTAWLWWPLAFLGKPAQFASHPERLRETAIGSLHGMTTIILSLFTLAGFIVFHVFPQIAETGGANPLLHVAGYMFLVDWSQIWPWQWLSMIAAVLSVVIIFWLSAARLRYRWAVEDRNTVAQGWASREIKMIERLARLRTLCVIAFIALVGGHTFLYFNSRDCWVVPPPHVQTAAHYLYGDRTPPPPVCPGD